MLYLSDLLIIIFSHNAE